MNQKRISVIIIITGVIFILTDIFVLPLMLILTDAAGVLGGSVGVIGGVGLSTLMLLVKEARHGILPVLSVVGILCIAVGIAVLILKKKYDIEK